MIVNGYKIAPNADLIGANLIDADLRGADLRSANLIGANLRGADLRGTNLGGHKSHALLALAPDELLPLRVAQAILQPGALNMDAWHSCETTHCLAGWAVHLSGAAGYALERVTSPSVAGCMLLPSACHLLHESNDIALEWAKGIVKAAA